MRSRTGMVGLAVGTALALCLLGATLGRAQLASLLGPEKVALVFDGDVSKDSGGIKITSWGSGKAEPSTDAAYVGPEVLKVTSHGPYQGVVLHLGRPVALEEFLASGAGYLDLRLLPAQAPKPKETPEQAQARRAAPGAPSAAGPGGARAGGGAVGGGMRGGGGMMGGGMRGGGGAMGGGGMRGGGGVMGGGMRGGGGAMGGGGMRGGGGMMGGGGMRGGGGMMGGGGMRGGAGAAAGRAPAAPTTGGRPATGAGAPGAAPSGEKALTLRNLRLVLFTDEGVMVADPVPVDKDVKDKRGWVPVSVALAQFRGAHGKAIRAVGLFAEESDTFYLGQVRLLVDPTPIKVTLKADPSVTRPDRVIELSAELTGGPVQPRFAWDFDASDGLQEQAVGPKVKYLFKKPGDYLVTCTVTDRAGVRESVAKTIGVRVEEAAK